MPDSDAQDKNLCGCKSGMAVTRNHSLCIVSPPQRAEPRLDGCLSHDIRVLAVAWCCPGVCGAKD